MEDAKEKNIPEDRRAGQMITREQSGVLKAIAILTVIITHANGFSHSLDNIPILKNGAVTGLFCHGGMSLFLILSGYGLFISFTQNGLRDFWDKKFRKIFLPVIVAQAGWYAIYYIAKYIYGEKLTINWDTLFEDVLCVGSGNGIDGSMWYMSFLLLCYISFYIFFGFFKKRKIAIIAFSVFWLPLMLFAVNIWGVGEYCVSSFAVGVWMAYISSRTTVKLKKWARAVLVALFASVGVVYYFVNVKSIIVDNLACNIIALAFIFAVGFFSCKKSKILSFIGKHSFSIYIFQGKIIFGWFPYVRFSAAVRFWAFVVLFAVNIIAAVLFDKVMKYITEKIKSERPVRAGDAQ